MDKFILMCLIFFLFLLNLVFPQELLKNPSFEEINIRADSYRFTAADWFIPNGTSVDYYSSTFQKSFPNISVPNNKFGYHPAYDGNAYIGLVIFSWGACDYELLTGSLKVSLKKDSLYEVSFMVRYGCDKVMLYSKSIDVYFTKDVSLSMSDVHSGYFDPYLKEIGITFNIEEAYKRGDWIRCKGIYKAKGGERYITIGSILKSEISLKRCRSFDKVQFDPDPNKTKDFIYKNEIGPIGVNRNYTGNYKDGAHFSYYFIDGVSVRPAVKEDFTF